MDNALSNFRNPPAGQRGMVTLIIALIILVSMTIITVYTARVGVFEQRTSANEVRSEQVMSSAEFGVQQGLAYLERNKNMIRNVNAAAGGWMAPGATNWVQCAAADVTLPCGDGFQNVYGTDYVAYPNVPNTSGLDANIGTYTLHYVTRCVSNGAGGCAGTARPQSNPVIDIVSQGTTADTGGTQLVKNSTHIYPLILNTPDAPIVATGTVPLSGNFHIVTAANAGGEGVPVSVWSGDNADTDSTSFGTCYLEEFLASGAVDGTQSDAEGNTVTMCSGCVCDAAGLDPLTVKGEERIDILDVDGNFGTNEDTENFPPDMFKYVFGVPIDDYQDIRKQATVINAAGCSALDTSDSGLFWVEGGGECDPADSIGSFAAPVMLVLDRTDFKFNAGDYIFGVIFSFHPDAYDATPPPIGEFPDVTLNGGPTIYGAFLSVGTMKLNGTMRMRYDSQTLENLATLEGSGGLGPIAGTWADLN